MFLTLAKSTSSCALNKILDELCNIEPFLIIAYKVWSIPGSGCEVVDGFKKLVLSLGDVFDDFDWVVHSWRSWMLQEDEVAKSTKQKSQLDDHKGAEDQVLTILHLVASWKVQRGMLRLQKLCATDCRIISSFTYIHDWLDRSDNGFGMHRN